jgi:hypothetical protein
MTVLGLY